jgi:hypothetical protein
MDIKMKRKWLLSSTIFMLTVVLLSACDGDTKTASNAQENTNKNRSKPTIGALITDLSGLGSSDEEDRAASDEKYRELDWKELAPDTAAEDKIIAKYQPKIDKIPEGGKDAQPLYDKMLAEFNALPANPKLDGQKIKIPGYVTVLEQNKGLVSEFLLVPYYGACIHVPPPPLNNTLLIKPKKNQRIHLDDTYSPVWVKGIIHTKNTKTDLATAGYLIKNAEVELFDSEE